MKQKYKSTFRWTVTIDESVTVSGLFVQQGMLNQLKILSIFLALGWAALHYEWYAKIYCGNTNMYVGGQFRIH